MRRVYVLPRTAPGGQDIEDRVQQLVEAAIYRAGCHNGCDCTGAASNLALRVAVGTGPVHVVATPGHSVQAFPILLLVVAGSMRHVAAGHTHRLAAVEAALQHAAVGIGHLVCRAHIVCARPWQGPPGVVYEVFLTKRSGLVGGAEDVCCERQSANTNDCHHLHRSSLPPARVLAAQNHARAQAIATAQTDVCVGRGSIASDAAHRRPTLNTNIIHGKYLAHVR